MRRPLVLYSTNTWLAFNIAERYYRGRHYIWCTPFFNGRSDKGEAGFVPPTSCPWEIYRFLYLEWRAGDRHSAKIGQNREGILRGAQANRNAAVISEAQESEIASIAQGAEIRDFEPMVYVMAYGRVSDFAGRRAMDWSSRMGKLLDARPHGDVIEGVSRHSRDVASRRSGEAGYFTQGISSA